MADAIIASLSRNSPSARLHVLHRTPRNSPVLWLWSMALSMSAILVLHIAQLPSWASYALTSCSGVIPLRAHRFASVQVSLPRYSLTRSWFFAVHSRCLRQRQALQWLLTKCRIAPPRLRNAVSGFVWPQSVQVLVSIASTLTFVFCCQELTFSRAPLAWPAAFAACLDPVEQLLA